MIGFNYNILLIIFKIIISLMLIPFVFKLTIAPFSIWIINVYTHLPTILIMLLMTIYKIIYVLVFIKLALTIIDIIPFIGEFWIYCLIFFIFPSMYIGCLAYRQTNIKTILAYTTVSQIGYIMSGLIVDNTNALKYSFIYLFIYCAQIFGILIIFVSLKQKINLVNINQLYLLQYYNKFYYYVIFIIFLSLAGIPPLSGFFLKYFLFLEIYNSGFFVLAFTGLLSSFIMAIIYLQLVLQLMLTKKFRYSNLIYSVQQKIIFKQIYFKFFTNKKLLYFFVSLLLFVIIFFILILPSLSSSTTNYLYSSLFLNNISDQVFFMHAENNMDFLQYCNNKYNKYPMNIQTVNTTLIQAAIDLYMHPKTQIYMLNVEASYWTAVFDQLNTTNSINFYHLIQFSKKELTIYTYEIKNFQIINTIMHEYRLNMLLDCWLQYNMHNIPQNLFNGLVDIYYSNTFKIYTWMPRDEYFQLVNRIWEDNQTVNFKIFLSECLKNK
jgi:formate hydrogenlyase subunit 3/multisubunit Na+/H+ antiporter MnhD subunit